MTSSIPTTTNKRSHDDANGDDESSSKKSKSVPVVAKSFVLVIASLEGGEQHQHMFKHPLDSRYVGALQMVIDLFKVFEAKWPKPYLTRALADAFLESLECNRESPDDVKACLVNVGEIQTRFVADTSLHVANPNSFNLLELIPESEIEEWEDVSDGEHAFQSQPSEYCRWQILNRWRRTHDVPIAVEKTNNKGEEEVEK
jgi:hypothetical protein